MKIGIELRISYSDPMLNYKFSQELKILGHGEFNYLTIILTHNNKQKNKRLSIADIEDHSII